MILGLVQFNVASCDNANVYYCILHAVYHMQHIVCSKQQALVLYSEHFITTHKLCCTSLIDVPVTFFSVRRKAGNVTLDLLNFD